MRSGWSQNAGARMMNYTLKRKKRKSIAIHVNSNGVEVRAPFRMSQREINEFVTSKEKWITDKLMIIEELAVRRDAFTLNYGDMLLYRGIRYPILGTNSRQSVPENTVFLIPQDLPPGNIKTACIRIYRELAMRDLTARTFEYTGRMNVAPATIKVSGAKKRWGSCSTNKNINFSWRLIMADDEMIDYVIVHELAHLIELNHSAQFWAIVEGVLPDYRDRKARLRALRKRIAAENWDE